MATVVNDLVTRFGFDGSIRPLQDYNTGLTGAIQLLAGMVAGVAVATGGVSIWATAILGGVNALDALSNQTDVAVEKIQSLRFIAGQTQSTSEALDATLAGLSSTIGAAAQQGSEDFARLGISIRDSNGQLKTADVILEEVRQRFGQMNLTMREQETLAGALGIDASLLQMLNLTNDQFSELNEQARGYGLLSKEQTEQAAEYSRSLNSVWFNMGALKQLIAVGLAPSMTELADTMSALIRDNRYWVVNGVQTSVTWLGHLWDAVQRLAPIVGPILAGFVAFKTVGPLLAALASPVAIVTGAIVGLLAIVDDLVVAFNGGQSVIRDFFQEFLGVDIVEVLTGVLDKLKSFWSGVVDTFKSLAGFLGFELGVSAPATLGPEVGAAGMVDNRQVVLNADVKITTSDPQAAGAAVGDSLQKQLGYANRQLGTGGV